MSDEGILHSVCSCNMYTYYNTRKKRFLINFFLFIKKKNFDIGRYAVHTETKKSRI